MDEKIMSVLEDLVKLNVEQTKLNQSMVKRLGELENDLKHLKTYIGV